MLEQTLDIFEVCQQLVCSPNRLIDNHRYCTSLRIFPEDIIKLMLIESDIVMLEMLPNL